MKRRPRPYLAQKQHQYLTDTIRITPCHSNRASEAGHPCVRYLYFARTRWKDRKAHGAELQAIFELGKDLEDIVVNRWLINRLGLSIVRPKDRDYSYPSIQVTGHLDAYIEEEITKEGLVRPLMPASEPDPAAETSSVWVPAEIKGVAIGTWNEVDSFEDILTSSRPWVRKYAGQMLLYLLMDNKEYGRFVIFSKEKGRLKDIPVVLADHLEEAEAILKRLEVVNQAVADGKAPPRFYEPGFPDPMCEECSFGHICLPGGGYQSALQLVDDDVLAEKIGEFLDETEILKDSKAKLLKLDKTRQLIRDAVKGKETAIIGDYHVTGREVKVKGRRPYWKWDAKKVGGDG